MSKDSNSKQKKIDLRKISAALIATILMVAMAVGLIPNSTAQVLAADKTSDISTISKYKESLGDNASTEYAGRIWTDKTVWSEEEVSIEAYGGNTITIENDEDFLVGFSALATSQSVSGEEQAPIDVVFIIDISGSMSNSNSNMTNDEGETYSRIKYTVDAVNDAIDELMALNEYTRVGVVAFSSSAVTLLPLDRYTKTTNRGAQVEYFTLSRTTGSNEYATLYTNAVNSSKHTITSNQSVSGGTNTQAGIYQGMNLLATEKSTTATINGKDVQRVPSVVLLSDGASTFSCSNNSWWALTSYNTQGPGSSSYYGNGMLAMMTGAYMKDAVDRNYGVADTAYATTLYTIGMGVNDLVETQTDKWGNVTITDTSDRDLARVTLNPGTYFDDTTNSYAVSIKNAWQQYCGTTGNDTTPNITIKGGDKNNTYTLNHPTTNYDISGDDLKTYVDQYYEADDADSIATVFDDIVSDIAISTPKVPTEHDVLNPTTSGYITYTDPIGEYMEIKDMKAIIYAGHKYEAHTVETEGNVITYTFTETAEGNAVYGSQELSSIIIEVESKAVSDEADGIVQQTMTIKIPAALIPLRVNTVQLNSDGTIKSHTNNGTYPIRVLYTVGIQDAVVSDGIIATDKLSTAYVQANTNSDGTINFYSNLYTGQTSPYDSNITIGDATVEFTADESNPFYYMQEDVLLFEDEALTIPAIGNELDDNTTYYYKETHYHGTTIEVESLARTGAQLKNNTALAQVQEGENRQDDGEVGQWYRPAGTVRTNRMLVFEGTKTANATKTADDFYTPTYNNDTDSFVVYLGNNGVMSVIAGGSLAISKEVIAASGLTVAADKEFTFTVDLDGATGTYVYEVVDASGNIIRTEAIQDGEMLVLKDGETATILNLPPDTDYTVTEVEANKNGFTTSSSGTTGTVVAGETAKAEFTNYYSVTPVTFPAEGKDGITGTKVLDGREWKEGVDSYTFLLTALNNAPLPKGYDAEAGINVTEATGKTADGNDVATFDFGTITFTEPGLYRYSIIEKEPTSDDFIPGISYSGAMYVVTVEVVDNGEGALVATSKIWKLYADDATPLFSYNDDNQIIMKDGQTGTADIVFTNTYSAESVTVAPVATKTYTDNSGNNPITAGMFKFELEPLGYLDANGDLVAGTASENPMPLDSDDNKLTSVITENEGENITFPAITFTHQELLSLGVDLVTYRYKMTEILPKGATAENNYTVNGMKYDATEIYVDVTISIDEDSNALQVNTVYSNGKNVINFVNEYTPVPVTIGEGTDIPVEGTKTLTGRNMKTGESFEFAIVAADDATTTAIADKVITMPTNTTESVSGGTSGEAVAFEFDQITFTKPGVYTFNISEVIPERKAGGVTYDEHVCTVTVTVTDNNGALAAAVAYSNGTDFVNTYKATFDKSTAISLSGAKNMTGRSIEEGEFYFEVTLDNGARATYVPATSDDTADDKGVYEGAIQFLDTLTYTEAGTYVYYIREVIPTPGRGGMTYDTAKYRVTVVVTDDLEGTLSAEITEIAKSTDGVNYTNIGANDEITFTNTYTTTAKEVELLEITKIIRGMRGTVLKAGEFTFKVSLVSGDADGVTLPSVAEVTNGADGKVVFGNLTFTKVGTYVIKVEEVIPSNAVKNEDGTYTLNGITYSTNVIQSTFHVTDNLEGELIVTRTGTIGSREFVNTYNTTGTLVGSTDLVVTKNFTGREGDKWLDTDSFSFVLEANDANTEEAIANGKIVLPKNATGITIDATDDDKKATFGDIVFHEAGTYSFMIREVAGTIPGVDYDATTRIITVMAKDNSDGTLTTTASGNTESDLTFHNVYNPDDVILYGHGNLKVTKVFTGRENDEWLVTDNFTFTLEAYDDATKTAVQKGAVTMASTELTLTNDNKDYGHFGNITFTEDGTYKFVVKETKGSIIGVTYDGSEKIIVVNVIDNADGTMRVAIDASSDALIFSNEYQADSVELIGETNLKIAKTIDGREWTTDDEFKFVIEAGDTFTEENAAISQEELVVKLQGALMTATDSDTVETYFGNVTLKEAGTYRFRILEENPGDTANMAYDRHSTVVIVTVADNYETGKLEVTDVTYIGSMTWTNVHTPDSINVTLTGVKQLDGRTLTSSDKFNFTIAVAEGSEENTPLPTVVSLQNLTSSISFGPLTFTEEGTYKYIIRESGIIAGVTNDSGYVVATVKVTDADENGELEYAVSYEKKNAADEVTGDEFKFVNTYSSAGTLEGKTNLKVIKNFTGRKDNAWLDSDVFTFTLAADSTHANTVSAVKDGYIVLPAETTLVVNKTNKDDAYFGDIKFTKAGTYQFTVTETEGSIAGVTYDTVARTIIVNVIDNGDGTMLVSLTTASATLTFTNTYKAKSITATLEGTKKMYGRDFASTDLFEFTVTAKDNAPLPTVTTVENDATGKIAFAPITYTEAGTYVYEITETGGSAAGVTDATKKVIATVTVEDKNVGQLEVTSIVYSASDDNGFVYTNKYTTTETDGVTIAGLKVVTPSEGNSYTMKGGEFTFEIAPATSNPGNDPIAKNEVTNAKDGTITFAEGAVYKQEGTYVYTVREVAGDKGSIGYDSDTYTVTVTVTDDTASAKLKTKATITKEGKAVDAIGFDNSYTPGSTSVVLYGKKVLNSEHIDLEANKFQFKLEATGTNKDKTPMPESGKELVYNDATGVFQFGTITYTTVGEYTYQINEVNSGEKGYSYDDTIYAVTVKVTDEDGALKASVTGLKNDDDTERIVFTNGYVPEAATLEGETAIAGIKKLTGRAMKAEEFKFQLIDKDNQVVAEATNDGDGNFKLEPVTFTKTGTYYYTIVETNTQLGGVTYDETVYTVKVEVTDKGGYLAADVTYLKDGKEADVVFENTYKAQPVGIQISAAKSLKGRGLQEGEFSFVLRNAEGGIVARTTNDANGLIVFDEIKYDAEGNYKYTISEKKGNASHVTYDDTIYEVIVTVVDQLDGTFKVSVDYAGINPVFTNTYNEPSAPQTGDDDILRIIGYSATTLMFAAAAIILYFERRRVMR